MTGKEDVDEPVRSCPRSEVPRFRFRQPPDRRSRILRSPFSAWREPLSRAAPCRDSPALNRGALGRARVARRPSQSAAPGRESPRIAVSKGHGALLQLRRFDGSGSAPIRRSATAPACKSARQARCEDWSAQRPRCRDPTAAGTLAGSALSTSPPRHSSRTCRARTPSPLNRGSSQYCRRGGRF